jgi:hypothetical protein
VTIFEPNIRSQKTPAPDRLAEDKRRRVRAIADHLWALGYRRILHVESETQITPENSAAASQGHLYARRA